MSIIFIYLFIFSEKVELGFIIFSASPADGEKVVSVLVHYREQLQDKY
jgi:hypothetical protein